jgi:hypothetical protein
MALAAMASVGFAATALAGNGSNFQQLTNGIDYFFGGFLNPQAPVGTHGTFRCVPSDVLHAPTLVVDPAWAGFTQGTYAAKVNAIHFTACASTGITAVWPNITLSSSDGDCRFAPGGVLNYGFASSAAFFGVGGFGWMGVGPLNGTTPGAVNLLALIGGLTFGGPFTAGPTGATVYGLALDLTALFGSPSTITVPGGESLTYWIAEDLVQGPLDYQYWVGSLDERNICSGMSFFASAIGTPNGAVFAFQSSLEWGMFVSTLDATLMAAVAPSAFGVGGTDTTMALGGLNPMDTGTGGRTLSLTGATPEGGNGLGFESLSFNSYDCANAFGGSGKLLFCNLMAVNALGTPSCGPWTAGYFGVPTGGPGGPVLSTLIPQNPRITGQLDAVALNLISNPVWTTLTLHAVAPGGNEYPMFPGFAAAMGGSTGNQGGFGIPVPNLAQLVGIQLYFSGVGLNAASSAIAKTANNGHSHQNGYAVLMFP